MLLQAPEELLILLFEPCMGPDGFVTAAAMLQVLQNAALGPHLLGAMATSATERDSCAEQRPSGTRALQVDLSSEAFRTQVVPLLHSKLQQQRMRVAHLHVHMPTCAEWAPSCLPAWQVVLAMQQGDALQAVTVSLSDTGRGSLEGVRSTLSSSYAERIPRARRAYADPWRDEDAEASVVTSGASIADLSAQASPDNRSSWAALRWVHWLPTLHLWLPSVRGLRSLTLRYAMSPDAEQCFQRHFAVDQRQQAHRSTSSVVSSTSIVQFCDLAASCSPRLQSLTIDLQHPFIAEAPKSHTGLHPILDPLEDSVKGLAMHENATAAVDAAVAVRIDSLLRNRSCARDHDYADDNSLLTLAHSICSTPVSAAASADQVQQGCESTRSDSTAAGAAAPALAKGTSEAPKRPSHFAQLRRLQVHLPAAAPLLSLQGLRDRLPALEALSLRSTRASARPLAGSNLDAPMWRSALKLRELELCTRTVSFSDLVHNCVPHLAAAPQLRKLVAVAHAPLLDGEGHGNGELRAKLCALLPSVAVSYVCVHENGDEVEA